MAERYAVTALKLKRAELAGELDELERSKQELRRKLNHVDNTLRLFDYEDDPKQLKRTTRRYSRMFRRGELQRLVQEIMRRSDPRPGNRDIAAEIVARKGWDSDDRELLATVSGKVKEVRARLRRRTVRTF